MMSPGEIRSALAAQPFRPFTIHLANQRSFLVPHPEYAAVHPKGRWVMVMHDDGGYDIADMLLVTGIHVTPGRSERVGPQSAEG
jgi:hypothetical protein